MKTSLLLPNGNDKNALTSLLNTSDLDQDASIKNRGFDSKEDLFWFLSYLLFDFAKKNAIEDVQVPDSNDLIIDLESRSKEEDFLYLTYLMLDYAKQGLINHAHPSNPDVSIENAVFSIEASSVYVDEGDSVTFTIKASDLPPNTTTLSYSIDGVPAQDLVQGSTAEYISLDEQGFGSITLNLAANQLTDGPRALTLRLDDAPQNKLSILVKDTSTTPTETPFNPAPTGNGEVISSYSLQQKLFSGYNSNFHFTNDNRIDSMLYGQMWGYGVGQGVELTYSFPTGNSHWSAGYGKGQQHNNFLSFTEEHKQATREALKAWSDIANVRFVEIEENRDMVGDLRFGFSGKQNDGAAGSAYYPTIKNYSYSSSWNLINYTVSTESGDVWMNSNKYNDSNWLQGSHNFKVLLHEIGHALGLKHAFDPNRGNGATLPEHENNSKYSVMAYATHPDMKRLYDALPDENGAYHWSTLGASSPMLYDALTIQHLYGANVETNTGDDVYTFSADTPFVQTIWDAGGNDTIDVSNQTVGAKIDLNEGAFSSIGIRQLNGKTITKAVDNVAIAFGTQIENATGSKFDDIFIGNNLDNVFRGNGGSDVAYGGGGTNTFIFEDALSSYEISGSIEHAHVTNGQDTVELIGIEMLLFSDQLYVLA